MSIPILKLLHAASPDADDADLLGRFAAARDEAAFAELVRRHGPAVYRVCRRLVPACADDAFQATFLVLACRASSVKKAASVGSWLIGVAGRVARQMARRERRAAGVSRLFESQHTEQPAHAGRSPETAELAFILDDELTRLPDHFRAAVVLCLVNGRTQEQAAAELGGSVRTLRRRLDQAKALLRLRLERRGVVPAVAVALVAGAGSASAVPPELGRLAVRGVFEFLAGGAAISPAAVVAKGVVGSMANLKATALVATAAAVLIALGVGTAQQTPPTSDPPPNVPLRQPVTLTIPALGPKPVALDFALPDVAAPGNRLEASFVHRSSNFDVTAPTALIARAVAAEAEFQREAIAKQWIGVPQASWDPRCKIDVKIGTTAVAGATTFDFGEKAGKPACRGAKMTLEGTFMSVLSNTLPHEVTHVVLAQHFGKPLPRWADEGIALLSESLEEQASHDERSRVLLNAGRGIRLKVLFPLKEYPRDMIVLYAQGHSVVRFLMTWVTDRFKAQPPGGPRAALVEFLQKGMDGNTADSWDKAAKDVYGFGDVDALEAQWLAWLANPKSQLGAPKPRKPEDANLIPPTKLPGVGDPPAAIAPPRPVGDALYSATRTISLPVSFDPDKNPKPDRVILYTSRDKTATWVLHGVLPTDKKAFVYGAPADGEYWFQLVICGADGRPSWDQTTEKSPAVKVVVDTTPPVVRLVAKSNGVEWSANDDNLDPASIKLQYKHSSWTEWKTVTDRTMKPSDKFAWRLKSGEVIAVRVVAKDKAGNEGVSAVVKLE